MINEHLLQLIQDSDSGLCIAVMIIIIESRESAFLDHEGFDWGVSGINGSKIHHRCTRQCPSIFPWRNTVLKVEFLFWQDILRVQLTELTQDLGQGTRGPLFFPIHTLLPLFLAYRMFKSLRGPASVTISYIHPHRECCPMRPKSRATNLIYFMRRCPLFTGHLGAEGLLYILKNIYM
jgi:hypothetical protein